MTKCPECQAEAQAGFKFCPSCGAAITTTGADGATGVVPEENAPSPADTSGEPGVTTEGIPAESATAAPDEAPAEAATPLTRVITGAPNNDSAKTPGPSPEEVAEQLRLLAEKEAEKERKKQERLQRMAEKKAERQQRLAEKKIEREKKVAGRKASRQQKKQRSACGHTPPAPAAAAGAPIKSTSPRGWALIIAAIIVAMGATGTAAFFLVEYIK